MTNNEFIEVHRKRRKRIEKVSIRKNQILAVDNAGRGTRICFLLHNGYGYLVYARCIESYDEVMALIKK